MEITYLLEQPKTRCREIHILKNFPNEYQGILKCEGEKFVEKLYNYIYKSPQHTCPVCGKETPFKNFISGHSQYCSAKCSANDDVKKEKAKTTMLEKYGVENISQLDSIKQQRLQTMETRYGKYFNNRKKAKTTMLEKYGYKSTL
jgi:flavodoxin